MFLSCTSSIWYLSDDAILMICAQAGNLLPIDVGRSMPNQWSDCSDFNILRAKRVAQALQ